jgi:hypothetical protein
VIGPITGKTDGVVAYESAHIEGVASEKIVRSGNSTHRIPKRSKKYAGFSENIWTSDEA